VVHRLQTNLTLEPKHDKMRMICSLSLSDDGSQTNDISAYTDSCAVQLLVLRMSNCYETHTHVVHYVAEKNATDILISGTEKLQYFL